MKTCGSNHVWTSSSRITTLRISAKLHEEIESRLNSRNACCHPVQNTLSSRLISESLKVKIFKITILPIVLCMKLCLSH